jgi:hypothetical protein
MTEIYVLSDEDSVREFCEKTGGIYRTINAGKWAVEIKGAADVDTAEGHFGIYNIIGFANWGD